MISNWIKTIVLLGILSAILIWIGSLFGFNGLLAGLIVALFINLLSFLFSHKIVLFMYRAKEAKISEHKDLHSMVEEIASQAKIPKPKVYIIKSETPNASATGPSYSKACIAVTTGIMKLLSKDELKGVIAHEISHVKNRDTLIMTIASVIASIITFAARFAGMFGSSNSEDNRGNALTLLLLMILTPIVAIIIQLAISRAREYLADESAAHITRKPSYLAHALAKLEAGNKVHPISAENSATASLFIVNPLSGSSLLSLFSTHPPIKERIKKLNELRV